jgi:hypothetical protein
MSREGNPNAESKDRLAGDMGVSSERVDEPEEMEGVEGTGTVGSAKGHTDGDFETHPDQVVPSREVHRQEQDVEENTADAPGHPNDPSRNPGHSHG